MPFFLIINYVPEKLITLLNKEKNKCIIDFGCGNGFITRQIIEKGFNVFGVDESASGIEQAKKHYPDRFFIQEFRKSPVPAELSKVKFDTIIASEVISTCTLQISF